MHEIDQFENSTHAFFYDAFERIYILHLSGSVERRENVDLLCEEIGSGRVKIIDAVTPSSEEFLQGLTFTDKTGFPDCFRCGQRSCGKNDCNNILIGAQIACFQTHYKAISDMVSDNVASALILEDDVFLHQYVQYLLEDSVEADKITNVLTSSDASLIKMGWALDSSHLPKDRIQLQPGDDVTMSNPAYALDFNAASLLMDALAAGVEHTADVIIHSSSIDGLSRYRIDPAFFSEKSWSTGEIESAIHPKDLHLEHLEGVLRDASPEASVEISRKIQLHEQRQQAHSKHCVFVEEATIDLGDPRSFEIYDLDDIQLAHRLFNPMMQNLVFGLKPCFIERLELQVPSSGSGDYIANLDELIDQIRQFDSSAGFFSKLIPDDAIDFLKRIERYSSSKISHHSSSRQPISVDMAQRLNLSSELEKFLVSVQAGSSDRADYDSIYSEYFNFQIQSYNSYKYFLEVGKKWLGASSSNRKKISVITVTYCAEDCIAQTLESIFSQDFDDFELIIVDGSPSSETVSAALDICRFHADRGSVDCVILRGRDGGIYDAMNKAIDVARGDWLAFMNAGDRFCNEGVLATLFASASKDLGFVYGNTTLRGVDGEIRIEAGSNTAHLVLGNLFSHQAVLINSELQRSNPYDIAFKTVADHNFYLKCYFGGATFRKVDLDVAIVDDSGVSADPVRRTLERWLSVRSEFQKHRDGKLALVDKFYLDLLSHERNPAPIRFYQNNQSEYAGLVEE